MASFESQERKVGIDLQRKKNISDETKHSSWIDQLFKQSMLSELL